MVFSGIEKYIDKIYEGFYYISRRIELNSKFNWLSGNVISENFFAEFLNCLHGYNLRKMETVNNLSVDLYDEQLSIYIQVTSRTDKSKIIETLKGFSDFCQKKNISNGRLKIYFLKFGKHTKYSDKKLKELSDLIKFNVNKDFVYLDDIIKEVDNLCDTIKQSKLADIVERSIGYTGNDEFIKQRMSNSYENMIGEIEDYLNVSNSDYISQLKKINAPKVKLENAIIGLKMFEKYYHLDLEKECLNNNKRLDAIGYECNNNYRNVKNDNSMKTLLEIHDLVVSCEIQSIGYKSNYSKLINQGCYGNLSENENQTLFLSKYKIRWDV